MEQLKIGGGRREISTEEPVSIPGQMYLRISQGIQDPLYVTALAIDGGAGQDCVIFCSCDLVKLYEGLITETKALVSAVRPELPVDSLGSQGSSVIKVFDMTAATTGINETNARKAGLDADTVILSPLSHAGYYPGGKLMTMKVVFEKETYRLLGAQIVGYDGVDKRIDVLATAIHAGMKATDLKDFSISLA